MKSFLFLLALMTSLSVTAQEVGDDDFDKVVAAYINLRNAAAINDTVVLKQVAEQLRRYNPSDFKTFHLVEDETMSLNGHIVFDEVFADSLSKGVNIYHQQTLSTEQSAKGAWECKAHEGDFNPKQLLLKPTKRLRVRLLQKA